MAKRLDVLRSFVRDAARAGAQGVRRFRPVANARELFDELRARRASLTEGALGAAIANGVSGAHGITVSIQGGRVIADVSYEDGESREFAIIPDQARFAPRGAKEVIFSLEPPEAVNDMRSREIVGAVAAAIARALWGPVLGPRPEGEHALVDREGARLRADLRTIPAVRATLEGSPLGVALDVISIESFSVEDRTLRLVIALPLSPLG